MIQIKAAFRPSKPFAEEGGAGERYGTAVGGPLLLIEARTDEKEEK